MTPRRHRIEFDDRDLPSTFRVIGGGWTVRLGDIVVDDQIIGFHVRAGGAEVKLLADLPFRRGEVVALCTEVTPEGSCFVCVVEETERD
jgi:hypothetical protein